MFHGGTSYKKLVDLEKLEKELSKDLYVAVGFPGDKQNPYPDGTPVTEVAVKNEFGSRAENIPPRPFLKIAMNNNKDKYGKILHKTIDRIVDGKSTKEKEFKKLGVTAQKDVMATITKIKSPPNSPVTVARKGSANPLQDTGQLRSSVTFEVRKAKKGEKMK